MVQSVKNPPAMWEPWIGSLAWEDPLEKTDSACSPDIGLEGLGADTAGGGLEEAERASWGREVSRVSHLLFR